MQRTVKSVIIAKEGVKVVKGGKNIVQSKIVNYLVIVEIEIGNKHIEFGFTFISTY